MIREKSSSARTSSAVFTCPPSASCASKTSLSPSAKWATGRIVSDVINYAAHLEKSGTQRGGLSISNVMHKKLPAPMKKLFANKHEFEGRQAYSLVYDFRAGIS